MMLTMMLAMSLCESAYDDPSAQHGYGLKVEGKSIGEAMSHEGVRDLDVLEIFSGSAGIKNAAETLGFLAVEYDRTTGGTQQDALTSAGWKTLVDVVLRVKAKGLVWFGTDCSFWGFPASSVHRRYGHWHACSENGIVTTGVRNEGNAARGGVRDANRIARRVAWCIGVLRERDVECILDNPVRSMLFTFPTVLNMLLAWGFFTIVGDMCRFAPSDVLSSDIPQKRLRFWGSPWWMVALGQGCRHRENHKPLMKKEGKFSGGGKELAESAAYAVRFCFLFSTSMWRCD